MSALGPQVARPDRRTGRLFSWAPFGDSSAHGPRCPGPQRASGGLYVRPDRPPGSWLSTSARLARPALDVTGHQVGSSELISVPRGARFFVVVADANATLYCERRLSSRLPRPSLPFGAILTKLAEFIIDFHDSGLDPGTKVGSIR